MPAATIAIDANTFDKFIKTLDRLDNSLGQVSSELKVLKKLTKGISIKIEGLDQLENIAKAIQKTDLKQLEGVIRAFQLLSSLKFDKNTEKFFQSLGTLANSLKKFERVRLDGTTVESLATLARLSSSIVKLFKNTEKINKKNAASLSLIIGALGTFTTGLAGILKSLPGGAASRELSLTFERVGLGISGMFRHIADINIGSAKKLVTLISILTIAVRGLSTILTFKGGAKGVKLLAQIFSAIANIVRAFSTGVDVKRLKDSKQVNKLILARIKSFTKIIKEMRKIKTKNIGGSAEAIKAIANLFKIVSDVSVEGRDNKAFEGPIKAISNLVKALQQLNKVKVNKNVAQSLNSLQQILALQGAQGQQVQKSAAGFGEKLSTTIAKGILKAEIAKLLFKTIASAFRNLNPIALTKRFIDGTIRPFLRLQSAVKNALNNVAQSVIQLGTTMTNVGAQIHRNFGVGALLRSEAFTAAAEFDKVSKRVEVFGNLSEETTKQVQALAFEIGRKYPLSANDAINASLDLVKAGLSAQEIESVLPNIADLTALSDSGDIERISGAMIQVVSVFDQFSDEIAGTFDNSATAATILSAAADSSVASVESIADGISKVGPIANSFGFTMEETSAALALFSNAGLDGARAGTQFKSLLNNLQTNTAKDQLKELGVTIADDAGNFKDLNTIVNELNEALNTTKSVTFTPSNPLSDAAQERFDAATKAAARASRQLAIYRDGLTGGALDQEKAGEKMQEYEAILANANRVIAEVTGSQVEADSITTQITRSQQQNAEAIKNLAGSYGSIGLNILLQEGEDGLANFIAQMNGVAPASERAMQLLDNFSGEVLQLQGSFETLMTKVFLPLLDNIFRPFIKGLRFIVDGLLLMDDATTELVSSMIGLGSIFASMTGGLLVFVGTFTKFGGLFFSFFLNVLKMHKIGFFLIKLIAGFTVGFAGFLLIIGPLVVLLTALAAGFNSLLKIFRQDIGGARTAFDQLTTTLGVFIDMLIETGKAILGIVGIVFAGGNNLEAVGTGIAGFFEHLNGVLLRFIGNSNGVNSRLEKNFMNFRNVFTGFFGFLTADDQIQSAENEVREKMTAVADVFGYSAEDIEKEAKRAGDKVRDSLSESMLSLADNPFIQGILGEDIDENSVFRFFTVLKGLIGLVRTGFQAIFNSIGTFFQTLGEGGGFSGALDKATQQLTLETKLVLAGLVLSLKSIFNLDLVGAEDLIDDNKFSGLLDLFFEVLRGKIRNFLVNNRDSIENLLSDIFKTFFVPGKIIGTIGTVFGIDALKDVFDEIERVFIGAFEGIIATIFNILEGDDVNTALKKAFGPAITPLLDFLTAIGKTIDTIIGIFTNLYSTLAPILGLDQDITLMEVINNVLTSFTEGLNFLNENVLIPLANTIAGIDFEGLVGFFGDIFTSIFAIVGSLSSGDFAGAIGSLADFGRTLANTFLDVFSAILDIDISAAVDIFDGFRLFFAGIIDKLIPVVESVIQGVPQLIKNVGRFLLDLLGFGDIDIDQDFSGIVTEIAGKISTALGTIPDKLVELGTTLGSPLITKVGTAISTSDWTPVATEILSKIQEAIEGIPGALIDLGTTFNAPLVTKIGEAINTGDWTSVGDEILGKVQLLVDGVATGLENLGTTFSAPLITKVGTALRDSDWAAVGTEITTKINEVLTSIPDTLIDLGTAFSAPLITKLGTSFKTGDFGPAVEELRGGLERIMGQALTLAATGITDLGTIFGNPFLLELGTALDPAQGGGFETGIQLIANNVVQVLKDALALVPGLLIQAGELTGLGGLITAGTELEEGKVLGAASGFADALVQLINNGFALAANIFEGAPSPEQVSFFRAIGNLISFPIDTFRAVAKGVQDIADAISGLKVPEGTAEALTAIFTALTVAKFNPAILTFLRATALPLAKLAFIVLIVKNAFDNLGELFDDFGEALAQFQEGDILGGLTTALEGVANFAVNTLTGITSDILGFLGIEISADQIRERVSTVLNQIVGLINVVGLNLSNQIAEFFNDFSLRTQLFVLDVQRELARANLGTVAFNLDVQAAFDEAMTEFEEGGDPTAFFNSVSSLLESGDLNEADLQRIRAKMRFFGDDIAAGFLTDLGNAVGQENIDAVVSKWLPIIAGVGDQIIPQLLATSDIGTLQPLFDALLDPNKVQITDESIAGLSATVIDSLNTILRDPTQAITREDVTGGLNLLDQLMVAATEQGISTDSILNARNLFLAQLEAIYGVDDQDLQAIIDASNENLPQIMVNSLIDRIANVDFTDNGLGLLLASFFEDTPDAIITPSEISLIVGKLEDEFTQIGKEVDIDLLSLIALSTTDPDGLTVEEFRTALVEVLNSAVVDVPLENVNPVEVAPEYVAKELTPEEQFKLQESMTTQVQETLDAGEGLVADVEVTPAATVQEEIDEALPDEEAPPPEFEAVTDSASAEALTEALRLLKEQGDLVIETLTTLAIKTLEHETSLITLYNQILLTSDLFIERVFLMSGTWAVFAFAVSFGITTMIGHMMNLIAEFGKFGTTVIAQGNKIIVKMGLMAAASTIFFNKMIKGFTKAEEGGRKLIKTLDEVISKFKEAQSLAKEGIDGDGGGGGGGGGGRAEGGSILGGRLYEIAEQGAPEIFTQGNRTFLVPGTSGKVIPAAAFNTAPSPLVQGGSGGAVPQQAVSRAPLAGFDRQLSPVEIQPSPITIEINATPDQNPQEIADLVNEQLQSQLTDRNSFFITELRNAGRI
jgi:TP901 family phage tail tape measure protein